MTENILFFELITPEQVIYKGALRSFFGATELGKFEILPGHNDMIAALASGILEIIDIDGLNSRFSFSGGFLFLRSNRLSVLTEKIIG
jgi:F0F1-type ATP synthase epsilon subunit